MGSGFWHCELGVVGALQFKVIDVAVQGDRLGGCRRTRVCRHQLRGDCLCNASGHTAMSRPCATT